MRPYRQRPRQRWDWLRFISDIALVLDASGGIPDVTLPYCLSPAPTSGGPRRRFDVGVEVKDVLGVVFGLDAR